MRGIAALRTKRSNNEKKKKQTPPQQRNKEPTFIKAASLHMHLCNIIECLVPAFLKLCVFYEILTLLASA